MDIAGGSQQLATPYAHHSTSNAWQLAAASVVTAIITTVPVLRHALKAATQSPVK